MTIRLTANACAIAVVAAARIYGDHPIRALEAKQGRLRRSLAAAARALSEATGSSLSVVCGALAMNPNTVSTAIRDNRPEHNKAFNAAVAALDVETASPPPAGSAVIVVEQRPATLRTRERPMAVVGVNPIRENRCRWPIGDPRQDDFTICDAQRIEGRSYCAPHCVAAGLKPEPKRTPARAPEIARPFSLRGVR